jgi:hypothetical protein
VHINTRMHAYIQGFSEQREREEKEDREFKNLDAEGLRGDHGSRPGSQFASLQKGDNKEGEMQHMQMIGTDVEQPRGWLHRSLQKVGLGSVLRSRKVTDSNQEASPDQMHGLVLGDMCKANGHPKHMMSPLETAIDLRASSGRFDRASSFSSVVSKRDVLKGDGERLRDDIDIRLLGRFAKLVIDRRFKRVVLVCVFINSACLMLQRPNQSGTETDVLGAISLCVHAVFVLEAIMRMLAFSVRGYFMSTFNRIDFVLLILWIGDVLCLYLHLPGEQAFAILRFLRPLRFVSRSHGLQSVMKTLHRYVRAL